MVRAIKIINDLNEELYIDLARPEKSGFVIENISGLGPVKADINITEMATMDGGIVNSTRVPVRNITMDISFYELLGVNSIDIFNVSSAKLNNILNRFFDSSKPTTKIFAHLSIEDIRHLSYLFFPIRKKIKIEIYTDSRSVYIYGIVESNDPDIFSSKEGCSISLVCADPYFKSLDQQEEIEMENVNPNFTFPFSAANPNDPYWDGVTEKPDDPIEFGIIDILAVYTFYYYGDSTTGFIFECYPVGYGPFIAIRNETNVSEYFSLNLPKILNLINDSSFKDGDKIIINSIKGEKKVTFIRDGIETNIISAIVPGSKWLTVLNGENRFSVNDGGIISSLKIEIPILYEGV